MHGGAIESRFEQTVKTATVLLAALILAGCVTTGDPIPSGPPATVTVYREPSPRDSLFPMLFKVDGRPVVQLQPEEERSLELPAGDYSFGYQLGLYDCSAAVRIESGETYDYRLAQGCVIESYGD